MNTKFAIKVGPEQPAKEPQVEAEIQADGNPFASSKLFNQTLSKMTSRYIQSKMMISPKESEDLKKIDLRHMCENVVHELEVVEKDAAYDYIKVSGELKTLSEEITKSDEIMEELEGVLYSFRDHLQSIKSEMTNLQERSLKMNTSLTNRKKLQKMLLTFVESAVLDKELIDAICLNEIDLNYVEHIRALLQKLKYLKNTTISADSKAVKELQPELQKLKTKASARLREFLIDQIQLLNKPKTNINIRQKEVLSKFKVFTEFLKDHFPSIYTQICNFYRETMSKIYLKNYKAFLFETEKLQIELYTKTDTLIPQDANSMRTFIQQTKPTTLNQEKKSIFSLMARDKVLDSKEQAVLYNIANAQGQKFPMEHIFKNINKMLIESVVFEVVFTADFFNLKSEEAIAVFGAIFKPSINVFLEYLKTTMEQTYDIAGVMLLTVLNDRNKKMFNQKSLGALDFYFDQVNMLLWPKFEQLFDFHQKNIKNPNINSFKLVQKAAAPKLLLQRYVDFMAAVYKIYSYFSMYSNMIVTRITQMSHDFMELLRRVAKEHGREFDSLVYYLNSIEYIYMGLNTYEMLRKEEDQGTGILTRGTDQRKKEYFEELRGLQVEIASNVQKIANIYMKDMFSSLYDFVKKYFKQVDYNNENYEQSKEMAVNAAVDAKLLEVIINDISQNLNKKIESLKTECQGRFNSPSGYVLKAVINKFITIFMNYYNAFYKYTKAAQPDMVGGLLPMHSVMKELKNHTKKYN